MKTNRAGTIKKQFEELEKEVGDYNPQRFIHLRERFFELYKDSRYRHFCDKDLKEGKNSAQGWLKANWYPIDAAGKNFLKFYDMLTEDSQHTFSILSDRYLFMIKNSRAFKERCDKLNAQGFNSFAIWLERYNYEPIFRPEELGKENKLKEA